MTVKQVPFAPPVTMPGIGISAAGWRPCACGKFRLSQGRIKIVNEGLERLGLRKQVHAATKCTPP